MADFDREIDKKVEGKFLIIDKKLKDAFTNVKKDLAEVKASIDKKDKTPAPETKVDTKQIEDKIELLNKEIERLSALSIKNPKVDNEKLKLEKQILQLKIKETREAQKNKATGRISRLINRIGVWKEKHKLNKQYRKQLEQINTKHDEFEQELIEKTKQLDKLYSKSANMVESRFNQSLDNIKKESQEENNRLARERKVLNKEFSRSLARIEQERQNDKQLFLIQNEQADNQRNQIIKELSNNINKSEKRFDKLIRDIESKRMEDNSVINNQLSGISQNLDYERKRTENSINELKIEINNLKSKKVRDEKKIQDLENEKNYFQNKLKEVKSIKGSSRSFKLPNLSLPKFSLPKFNFQKLNVNTPVIKEGFWLAVPYIFLAILAIVAANQYFDWNLVSTYTNYWIAVGVLFGALTFWHNRDKIETSMEDEKKSEELGEQKRASEFEYRFPRISKIWGLRSIVKWMYMEGFWYSAILIFIVLNGFFIRFDNLGTLSLQNDEFLTYDAVKYILSGNLSVTDILPGVNSALGSNFYDRGMPFSLGTALFVKIFNNYSPFALRFFSFFIGTLSILLVYYFFRYLKANKLVCILSAYAFSVFYLFVYYSRVSRMYSLFVFLFFLAFLVFLVILRKIENSENSVLKSLRENYSYVFLFLIVALIALITHLNFLFLFIILFLILVYEQFNHKKFRIPLLIMMGMVLILIVIQYNEIITFIPIWYFNQNMTINYKFLDYSYQYLSGGVASLILIFSPLPLLFTRKINPALKVSLISYFTTIFLFLFIVNGVQFHDPRYMIFIYEFYILIAIIAIYMTANCIFNKKFMKILFVLILFVLLISPLQITGVCFDSVVTSCPISHESRIWALDRWNYNYDQVYGFIKSNITSSEVLVGRSFYSYYLEDYNIANKVYQLARTPKLNLSLIKGKDLVFVEHPSLIYRTPEIVNNNDIYVKLMRSNKTLIYKTDDNKTLIYRTTL